MYSISADLPITLPEGTPLPAAFPNLVAAVEGLAQLAHERWLSFASGAPLPDGRQIQSRSGSYTRSIKMVKKSDFAWRVESDSPYAKDIEEGSPTRDMKTMLRTSLKVRIAKDGSRYLIIPFRHGTPGSVGMGAPMPLNVHEAAKNLKPSRVTGTAMVPNAIGVHNIATRSPVMITRRSYNWGERLPGSGAKGRALRGERYAGMVRFDDPSRGHHSTYMTFRAMSEKSSGWIRKAVPGYWPARATTAEIQANAQMVLTAAVEEDVRIALGGAS